MTDTKVKKQIEWLKESANYFESRDTEGEDLAHWANVYNAKNATEIATTIESQAVYIERLEGALKDLITLNDEYSTFVGEIFQDRIERAWECARAALQSKP